MPRNKLSKQELGELTLAMNVSQPLVATLIEVSQPRVIDPISRIIVALTSCAVRDFSAGRKPKSSVDP